MSVYKLANYLFVCEKDPFTGFGGCGSELLVEQKRGIAAAAEYADNEGWFTSKPGPWDDNREWQALCPACGANRDRRIAEFRAKRAAVSGGVDNL